MYVQFLNAVSQELQLGTLYTEKLDLQHFISVEDDNSRDKGHQAVSFRLHLNNGEVKLKAENIETREEWKGYICVVTQLEVPSTLSLLPGQILRLKEVAAREKERQSTAPRRQESQCFLVEKPDPEVYDDLLNTMPECFYKVSRNEAEAMLERHPENGSLIIRPSTENSNYSVTTMITQNSKGVIKHYKVTSEDSGFVIGLENPVTYSTLQEVVDHFIKVTNGVLKPYLDPKEYANKIEMSKDQHKRVQMKLLPMSRVAPIQRLSISPSEYPGTPGMMQKPCNSQQKLPLKQQLLKPAGDSSRGLAKEESEPNYMNNEILVKLNQINLADDRPPNYTAPKPWRLKHFTTGEDETSELMTKLMKRRERLADD
ncbi:signal-transducing adaptor protein 1-like [Pristis pectinata]|uniref:signal-transducing adaptor protein 1-like n=1 Tax=Pristis pectinata TaxID=685728 RepID=UPI00223CF462|nr:signal-transducing adaptor protein 1-like [Pristis pectinata]